MAESTLTASVAIASVDLDVAIVTVVDGPDDGASATQDNPASAANRMEVFMSVALPRADGRNVER